MSNDQPKSLGTKANINTVLMCVVLGAIGWVGNNINENNKKLSTLSEKIAVVDATNNSKTEQLNRIESIVTRQQSQINDLQIEVVRIKGKP